MSVPQIQILEPPIVYKPTPKNVLDGSYSYSPEPVKKKPKLEYVPKAKQHSHSKTPKYTPIATVPSQNVEPDFRDDDCADVFDGNDDFIKSESQSSESQAGVEEEPPTYIPTKIQPEVTAKINKKSYDKENGKAFNDYHVKEKSTRTTERNSDVKTIKSIEKSRDNDKISSKSKSHSHHTKDNGKDNKKDKDNFRNKEKDKNTERENNKQRDKDPDKKRDRKKESSSSKNEESISASNHKSSSSSRSSKSSSSKSNADLGSKSSSRHRDKSSTTDANDISTISKKPSSSHSKSSQSGKEHRSTSSRHSSSSSSSKRRKSLEQSKSKEISRASIDSPTIPSPSSVFDTDSDEDDVMAQCRLIFDEFKSQPDKDMVIFFRIMKKKNVITFSQIFRHHSLLLLQINLRPRTQTR